jgi:hypothetical protein
MSAARRVDFLGFGARGLALLLLVTIGSACGYHIGEVTRTFDADVHTIGIDTLDNETREIGIEKRLGMAIEREFVLRGPFKIANVTESDLVLSGTVTFLEDRPVAFNKEDEVLVYQTQIGIDLELRRRDNGRLVWQTHNMRVADDYESVASVVVTTSSDFRKSTLNPEDLGGFTDIQLAETRRREMLERMMGTLAHDIYDQIMEDF